MITPNRISIDLSHPNKRNAEAFLNSWDEPFIPEENGTASYSFRSTISKTKVELRFFDSFEEADSFGIAHYNQVNEKSRWSLNGSMLFVVSGDNIDKVRDLLSHFAGRE